MSDVFGICLLSNSMLSIVIGAVVVFICTRCGRDRGGSRLWPWPHTLSESYILFDAFDLNHLICFNDAIIVITFGSHSMSISDLFLFAHIDCTRAESKHNIR